jgi:hypothetical protein
MPVLSELQHSEDREGPFKIYIYDVAGGHMHQGGTWFRKGRPHYPDEEITLMEAHSRCDQAMQAGYEVRICDGGDNLVFHFDRKQIVHGQKFWEEVKASGAPSKGAPFGKD